MNKLDTVPVIVGGLSDFRLQLLEAAIRYSNEARAYSTSNVPEFPKAGFTLFSFVVTKEGEKKDFKILESGGNSFEQRILEFIEKSEEIWRPGVFRGEIVDAEFLIPMFILYSIDTPYEKRYNINFNYPKQE